MALPLLLSFLVSACFFAILALEKAMRPLLKEIIQYQQDGRAKPTISYIPRLPLLPRHLIDTFVELNCDPETSNWLVNVKDISLAKLYLGQFLQLFFSLTTSNGLVNRGSMFVFSSAQIRTLLGLTPSGNNSQATSNEAPNNGEKESREAADCAPVFERVLDIGSGDGGVTAKLAPLFSEVYVTEYSLSMRWRLWWRGFKVVDYRDPFHIPTSATSSNSEGQESKGKQGESSKSDGTYVKYDVVSCLNVLDRADTPLTLLRSIHFALKPNGILLLAVVLPWCPFVEDGVGQRRPKEKLPMEGGECCKGATFEASLQRLVDNVLVPCGFKLERWTKVPYLCEGNLKLEYAVLHDALFVLRKV